MVELNKDDDMSEGLYYEKEHLICSKFKSVEESAFVYIKVKNEMQILTEQYCKDNLIVFLVKGEFRIHSKYYDKRFMTGGSMFAIPKGIAYEIQCSAQSQILLFYFDRPKSLCSKHIISPFHSALRESAYLGGTLQIKDSMLNFIRLLEVYIHSGVNCIHLHALKKDEVFLMLRWFYSREDVDLLFYPIFKHTCSFRSYVLDNFEKVSQVSELISASNLSKSVFYEKFKKEFGISPKKWLTDRLKEQIISRIQRPDVLAKDLMCEFNFSSPEYLNSFCKKEFGMTPSDLINSYRN